MDGPLPVADRHVPCPGVAVGPLHEPEQVLFPADDEDDIIDALYIHPDLQPGEFNVCFPSQSFPYRPLADVAIGEQVWISNWSMTGNSKQAAFRKGAPVFPVPLPFASLCLHRVDAGCVVRLDYTIDLTFPANDQLEDVFDSLPVTGWEKSGVVTGKLPDLWDSADNNWKNVIKTVWKTGGGK